MIKKLALGFVLVLGSVIGTQASRDRVLCRESSAAFAALYAFNTRIQLQSAVPEEAALGFKHLLASKAVVLTRLREVHEMRAELGQGLRDTGLALEQLDLDEGSEIPAFSADGSPVWNGELNAGDLYAPRPEETFQTQSWRATFGPKGDLRQEVRAWLEKNKGAGTIALIATQPVLEDGKTVLRFTSGMIPGMKMPKRTLRIEQEMPKDQRSQLAWLPTADLFGYQACTARASERFNKLAQKIAAETPTVLNSLESADKTRWLWLASVQSRKFIDAAKAP